MEGSTLLHSIGPSRSAMLSPSSPAGLGEQRGRTGAPGALQLMRALAFLPSARAGPLGQGGSCRLSHRGCKRESLSSDVIARAAWMAGLRAARVPIIRLR
jgi:hypothetical protein